MRTVTDRFWAKVEMIPLHTCWEWTGAIANGYGQIHVSGKNREFAHRFSYTLHKGKIPEGLQIDHLCQNKRCVNPDHLEAVTQNENMFRTRISHCQNGHALTESNLYIRPNGKRNCRECRKRHY